MALPATNNSTHSVASDETQSISAIIEQHLSSGELKLPVFNHVASKVRTLAESEDVDIGEIAKLILQDQALAMQVLKYANSSFFAGLAPAKTVKDAATRLGTNQLVEIVVLVSSKENYRTKNKVFEKHMSMLWKHSVACALGCRWLARKLGYLNLLQEAFMSGLFHDIGKLFVLKILDDIMSSDRYQVEFSEELILEVVHALHCEKGVTLMEEWRLPKEYCDVVRNHHNDSYDPDNATLSIVRLVDNVCNKLGAGLSPDDAISVVTSTEAQQLDVTDIMIAELEITIEQALGIA